MDIHLTLGVHVQALKGRADVAKSSKGRGAGVAKVLPPWQVKGLRAALGDQAELIATSQQLAAAVELQLEQFEIQ